MHPLFALSMMITAVAPQNEESEDTGIAAKILVVAGTTATGALLGAALAGGTSFVAFSGDECARARCVDNPQLVVTPLATAGGGAVGALGGLLLGVVLADALHFSKRPTGEPAAADEFPDD